MIRFLRGLIYGIAAGFAAAIVLDHLDQSRRAESTPPRRRVTGRSTNGHPSDDLGDKAKKALLDELDAQL